MGRRSKTLKFYSAICRTKMDYCCLLYNTACAGRLKKLDSIHIEGIRIYTGAFKASLVEALHGEVNDLTLELIEKLNTLDDREDQNYDENERSIKSKREYLRSL